MRTSFGFFPLCANLGFLFLSCYAHAKNLISNSRGLYVQTNATVKHSIRTWVPNRSDLGRRRNPNRVENGRILIAANGGELGRKGPHTPFQKHGTLHHQPERSPDCASRLVQNLPTLRSSKSPAYLSGDAISSAALTPSASLIRPILSIEMLVSALSTAPTNVRWTWALSASSSWLIPRRLRSARTRWANTLRSGEGVADGTSATSTNDVFASTAYT